MYENTVIGEDSLVTKLKDVGAVAVSCQRKVPKNVTFMSFEVSMKNERGFSLVELLVVVIVIGVVATLAVPALQKAIRVAENGNTFASLRTMSSTQVGYYSQNSRFGRLSEINSMLSSAIGTVSGDQLTRGKFVFDMSPATPTDTELRQGYTITATRNVAGEGVIYKYEITQSGSIRQVLP